MLNIGHRGAMGHAPENTILSVNHALDMGVDMVEVDVMCCKSGEMVVIHDDRLERTTNGQGYVAEKSWDELKKLDAGNGQHIPLISDVLDQVNRKVPVNIEIKNDLVVDPLVDLLSYYMKHENWQVTDFLISSFDHHALRKFQLALPEIRIGVLLSIIPIDYAKMAERLGAWSINPCLDFINQQLVDDAHERGLKVLVWTVNYAEDMARMRELGVDGIFTNYPERIVSG